MFGLMRNSQILNGVRKIAIQSRLCSSVEEPKRLEKSQFIYINIFEVMIFPYVYYIINILHCSNQQSDIIRKSWNQSTATWY